MYPSYFTEVLILALDIAYVCVLHQTDRKGGNVKLSYPEDILHMHPLQVTIYNIFIAYFVPVNMFHF